MVDCCINTKLFQFPVNVDATSKGAVKGSNGPESYGSNRGRVSTRYKLYDSQKETMTDLTTSIKRFASLNRAPGATWNEATTRKAPHKG